MVCIGWVVNSIVEIIQLCKYWLINSFYVISPNVFSIDNFPPNITGETVFNITVGQKAVYNFTVVDEGDTFTVEVEGGIPQEASFEDNGEGEYTFSWNLEVVANRSDVPALSFQATDSGGAVSLLTPQVVVCPCTNDGECTLRGILNTAIPVLIMNCICPEGELKHKIESWCTF